MTFMVRKSLKVSQGDFTDQVATGASNDAPKPDKTKPPTGKPAKIIETRTRLSCDIAKPLHRRLRLEAVNNDTTIVAVIEKLIENGTEP